MKINREKTIFDVLYSKQAFLNKKNLGLKNPKNRHFSKEVSPWFWSKIGYLSIFPFLPYLDQENVSFDCLEGKNVFSGYKNRKLRKSKNRDFCKGVSPWFWSKIGNFVNVSFYAKYTQKKYLVTFWLENKPF